ncbi:hypothetical protein [Paracoccus marcusii]|uniref:Uncharacterized protein n=1 Tax=Paracoccus marcusii TaxID=59779 RepID=A0ABY7UP00_9RHOB|nr:hypothetical protein [Paracoccus marcusii]WDA11659.1 hypothetical protein PRL19_10145 [Paracoccus marcusii]
MMPEEFSRKSITFEQAEGEHPLPRQLRPKELTAELRSLVWATLYETIGKHDVGHVYPDLRIMDPWHSIMRRHHVFRLHLPSDEYDPSFDKNMTILKRIIFQGDYLKFFGFLEWLLRLDIGHADMSQRIDHALIYAKAAYRVVDNDTIAPYASEQEAVALEAALHDIRQAGFSGASQHLRAAASLATGGKWSDSIRESVHAVEASARMLAPGTRELGPALSALERNEVVHAALKKGFGAIYGFSSDEQGIRHPLVDDPKARPGEEEAMFMLGACAAFISYLINKGRQAGLVKI